MVKMILIPSTKPPSFGFLADLKKKLKILNKANKLKIYFTILGIENSASKIVVAMYKFKEIRAYTNPLLIFTFKLNVEFVN